VLCIVIKHLVRWWKSSRNVCNTVQLSSLMMQILLNHCLLCSLCGVNRSVTFDKSVKALKNKNFKTSNLILIV